MVYKSYTKDFVENPGTPKAEFKLDSNSLELS